MGGALPAHHHHQQHQRQYSGLLDALRRIPQREGGLRALYRGNGANVLRLLPDVGVRFLVHDQFKVMFAPGDGTPAGHAERVAAGAATGTLKTLLLHPLDTARVRIATDQSPAGEARAYSTVRGCLADTLRTDGLRGWYRGLVPALFSTAPHLAVLFGTYDYLKALLPSGRGAQESALFPFLKVGCGCVAAVSAQLVTYPLDTVRRCLQVSGARGMTAVSYRSARDCARRLLRQHGLAGFYRGCSVACLRAAPGAALQFVAYDAIKVVLAVVDPRTGISSPLM